MIIKYLFETWQALMTRSAGFDAAINNFSYNREIRRAMENAPLRESDWKTPKASTSWKLK